MKKQSLLFLIITFTAISLLIGCSKQEKETDDTDIKENPIVTIIMEDESEIEIELYPNIARNTVRNFIALIEDNYYDGVIFHRVIPGFMVQGGDPSGTGMGGPDYSIKGEFNSNNFENDLIHERGVISMARSSHPDSAGSQFFIMVADAPHLDGNYAGFGKVIQGMEIVDEIVDVDRDANDKPVEEQKIKTMTVNTKGYTYQEPETIAN
ncbi:peptidylprolyl isomerase [Ornithinibacillus sp. 4-3]|uniref:Peptidyl-prolyl cis-trans isomerase n=1 Tax=Ornithinibacillus sp. 4-3 TaxID=3231488 RepID=A0AB39HU55_9BACI